MVWGMTHSTILLRDGNYDGVLDAGDISAIQLRVVGLYAANPTVDVNDDRRASESDM